MSRIPPKASYPWYIRLLLRFQKKSYGAPMDPVLLWGRIPSVFMGFLFMLKALNRKKSPIPPQLRSLVMVKTAQIYQCAFCIDINSAAVLQKGASEQKLLDLPQFRDSALFNDKEKAALNYAEAMAISSEKIPEALMETLRQHFDDDAIVELTALIAVQILSNKFNTALDAAPSGLCKLARKPSQRSFD